MNGGRLSPSLLAIAALAFGYGAETRAEKALYESSIGGVVGASNLPGKLGQGYLVYNKWCAGCHAAPYEPPPHPGEPAMLSSVSRLPLGTNIIAQRTLGAVPTALDQRIDLTSEAIGSFVRNGLNAMPPFRKTEISDGELEALSAYLTRNHSGSKSGE
ncbi:c-type cytochrome [Methylocella silvestris]|uniref:Cytochrome c domain-containing protein n=1 Tax=Methylocella silvestris TaxID=199596 RepID=A0A2J7TC90_METSI|nr:cytochrome c [Methylocella silvestris]PNG24386.1 hypothetical protein CR492_19050 [Methylocella silvestris]